MYIPVKHELVVGSEVALVAGVRLFPGVGSDVLLQQKLLGIDLGTVRALEVRLAATLTSLHVFKESFSVALFVMFGEIRLDEEVVFTYFALYLGYYWD